MRKIEILQRLEDLRTFRKLLDIPFELRSEEEHRLELSLQHLLAYEIMVSVLPTDVLEQLARRNSNHEEWSI